MPGDEPTGGIDGAASDVPPTPVPPTPFRIGVRPLRDAPWLRIDAGRAARLAHKRARLARDRAAVYRRVSGHEALEREALGQVEGWLAARGESWPASDDPSPLCRAALGVVEDLAVMSRAPEGWVLVSACVACPSLWRLADKIGRPLQTVHAPVPGFGAGTDAARLITRMLDALRPGEPVVRGNWSLHATDRLYLPEHDADHAARLAGTPRERLWYRHERQTLSKLPRAAAVLFTIDVTLTRVGELDAAARRALDAQIDALDAGQRAYRGLDDLPTGRAPAVRRPVRPTTQPTVAQPPARSTGSAGAASTPRAPDGRPSPYPTRTITPDLHGKPRGRTS